MNHKENFDCIVTDCIEDIKNALRDGYDQIDVTGERETFETRLFDLGLVKFDSEKAPSFEELFKTTDLYIVKKGFSILPQIACNLQTPGVYEMVKRRILDEEKYETRGDLIHLDYEFYTECLNKYKVSCFEEAESKPIVAVYQTPGIGTVTITKKDGNVTVEIKQEQDNG